jgi:hypothetical protein
MNLKFGIKASEKAQKGAVRWILLLDYSFTVMNFRVAMN